jgi:hypothetical protein
VGGRHRQCERRGFRRTREGRGNLQSKGLERITRQKDSNFLCEGKRGGGGREELGGPSLVIVGGQGGLKRKKRRGDININKRCTHSVTAGVLLCLGDNCFMQAFMLGILLRRT